MNNKLVTPESPLLVPPLLAAEIGLEAAMILQQIHYLCSSSKHILKDGRRWFWLTFQGWAEKMPFLKVSAIRRAIDKLKQLGLIDVFRHSQHTWYQANWYTVNQENVKALWLSICQNQQIQMSSTDTSNYLEEANHIKENSTETFSSQQQAAVNEEIEPDWDALKNQTEEWEQVQLTGEQEECNYSTDTLCVDESEQANSSNKSILHEDNSPASVEKPSSKEIRLVCNELRQKPCSPAFKLNQVVQQTIVNCWQNVPGAIAYLREALRTWKRVDKPEAVFVKACQEGRKPEGSVAATGFKEWYDWAYKQRFVQAAMMINGVHSVMLSNGKWCSVIEAMQQFNFEIMES